MSKEFSHNYQKGFSDMYNLIQSLYAHLSKVYVTLWRKRFLNEQM